MLNETIEINDGVRYKRTFIIVVKSDGFYNDTTVKKDANKLADSIYENVSSGFLKYLVDALIKNQRG